MPRVLVVASTDLSPELGDTVLWGAGVRRSFASNGEVGLQVAKVERPNMVVLDGDDSLTALSFVRRLRAEPLARSASIAVLSRSSSLLDEEALRSAGANVVLSGRVDPSLWNRRLEILLNVPPRREARFPVLVDSWSRFGPEVEPLAGWALNISVRGVLLETSEALDLGTKVDLRFSLPSGGPEVRTMGQVVREGAPMAERARAGVEFLILMGQARDRISWFVERTGEA
ncbi:MAG: PilZ domain-containing protein [Vicinamibacteria bacterium]